jgi:hypothetical protein
MGGVREGHVVRRVPVSEEDGLQLDLLPEPGTIAMMSGRGPRIGGDDMRFLSFAMVVVLALGLVACGGDENGETPKAGDGGNGNGEKPAATVTPTEAFQQIKDAWGSGGFAKVYGMLSADTRTAIDEYVTQARELAAKAMEQAGAAADLAKAAFKEKWGVAVDDLMGMSAEDAGGAMIGYVTENEVPGVFKPESKVVNETIEGDKAVLTVEKPNGKTSDVEMVKEGDTWVLVYDW